MADPKVLEAQEWVNATYAGKAAGYIFCPPDGSTGWATVFSLTQGLQHELGISPTVQNFGAGTFAKVKARNLRPGQETNKNIVRIYNYALWCKGYAGSSSADTWDSTAEASLFALGQDMGGERNSLTTNPDADLWARITKSMLRMDQFRMIAGGSATTRHFQQYLNSRYVNLYRIPAMEIVPCDGHYDRVTQQGLMMAIQREIGLNPADINGYFGEKTKAGLTANALKAGDQSDLAYLLHAACHFNSPTYDGYEKIHFPWDSIRADGSGYKVTTETEGWLRAFQDFTQNAVHGVATFQTWAQLLVSMGDSSRAATASDTIVEITPERATALKREGGFKAVGRYLDEHLAETDPYYLGKALKSGEAKRIVDAGLALIPLFQYNGTQVWNFDYERGHVQGTAAHNKAREHGIPPGSCIYFAVDYDAQDHEITDNVIPYFNGVRTALGELGGRYQFGVYGTRNVCSRVSLEAGARWSFVAGMSWGYSGNLGFPLPVNWSLNQIFQHDPEAVPPNGFTDGIIAPIGLDRNVWRNVSDPAVTSLDQDGRYDEVSQLVDFVAALEDAAREYHGPNADNVELIRNVVLTFFRQHKYGHQQWNVFGGIDTNFIDFAAEKNLKLQQPFRNPQDPVSHLPLDMEHTLAACQGHLKYYETGGRTDLGDGTGWLGDLLTFYAEWRNEYSDLSGAKFCSRYLANLHTTSAYGDDDWKADADAFNLASRLHGSSSLTVSQALRTYFLTPNLNDIEFRLCQRRFNSFYAGRFGGSRSTLTDRVKDALLGVDSSLAMNLGRLILGRDLILDGNIPGMIPGSELDSFVGGYTDKLIADLKAEPNQP